jgi:NADPH:quinone reductase-like Zn-dependent oxidoreductase
MRALRYDRFGAPEVLQVVDLAEPVPKAGEVKVRVHAASLNPLDWKLRAGHMRWVPGFSRPPRTLGCDFAGEIVGVGGGAISHYVGQRVFGALHPFRRDGTLAEFAVAGVGRLAAMPDNVDFEQAAALPIAGGTAHQALVDDARLAAGQRVLITGAGGGVGHFAVQVAKHLGAHVVAVCSAANIGFVRGLGADEAVDYGRDDFTQRTDRFDVVFDAACASSFAAARAVLTENGCYLNTGGDVTAVAGTMLGALVARVTSRHHAIPVALKSGAALWQRIAAQAQQGVLHAHIERTIALEDVADAQRAMETGHGRGKIVVRIA